MNESKADQQQPMAQVIVATAVVTTFLAGAAELIAKWVNWADEGRFTTFGWWTLLWAVFYFVVAIANSWWIGRFANMPSVGWLSGICIHLLGSVLIAPLSGVLAIAVEGPEAFLTRLGEGGIVALVISPVTAIVVIVGELLRHASLKGKLPAAGVGAAGTIVWLLVLLLP